VTPDERDRLRTVEVRIEGLDDWLRSIDTKLEELRIAANMGRGAWLLILKLGAILTAIGAAVAWLFDHLSSGKHP
jgi:hypothetical protein